MEEIIFSPQIQGAVIGGAISLSGALIVYNLTKRHASKKDKLEKSRLNAGLLRSIDTELNENWEHWVSFGRSLRDYLFNMGNNKRSYDLFTFYNSNASKIGDIKNEEIRVMIVKTYTKYKHFDELLGYYVEAVRRQDAAGQHIQVGENERCKKIFSAFYKLEKELENTIGELNCLIDEELKNFEKTPKFLRGLLVWRTVVRAAKFCISKFSSMPKKIYSKFLGYINQIRK